MSDAPPRAARWRRIARWGGVALALCAIAIVCVRCALAPPSTAWVLLAEHRYHDRVTSCRSPDGDALPDDWFVFESVAEEPRFHLHRVDAERAPFLRWMDRLLGPRSSRNWACAPCRETGRTETTASGVWIEVEPTRLAD